MLAKNSQRMHNASMPIQITVRNVSEEVRDRLAARAAMARQSMQEYLRSELERIASRPTVDAWLAEVRRRKRAAGTRLDAAEIVEHVHADRR